MRISDWSSDVCSSDLLISVAAKGAFPDTATGIAGTVSGDYFYAASGVAPDKTVGLYLNDVGLAVKQSDLATSGDITSLDTPVTTAPTAIPAPPTSAQLDAPAAAARICLAKRRFKDTPPATSNHLPALMSLSHSYSIVIYTTPAIDTA